MAKTLVEGTGMETLGGFLKSVAKRVWGEREWSSTILKNIWQNLCVNFQMFKLLLSSSVTWIGSRMILLFVTL